MSNEAFRGRGVGRHNFSLLTEVIDSSLASR